MRSFVTKALLATCSAALNKISVSNNLATNVTSADVTLEFTYSKNELTLMPTMTMTINDLSATDADSHVFS